MCSYSTHYLAHVRWSVLSNIILYYVSLIKFNKIKSKLNQIEVESIELN